MPEVMEVVLVDGSTADLAGLAPERLDELHWQQECAYAQRILTSPKGSAERSLAFRDGYDTVTKIIAQRDGMSDGGLVMGLSPRYGRLVLDLLNRQQQRGVPQARLFEIGYGSGAVLDIAAQAGFGVAGIEVSSYMRDQALARLPQAAHAGLHLGDYLALDLGSDYQADVVYWNDVFEHLPPDENLDYLHKTYDLLAPGGVLLTITPNWHVRPSDVTDLIKPPRSEAEGFHLKEYTLREMRALLLQTGFRRVATPLFVTHQHTVLCGTGLARLKAQFEPLLERMPFSCARLLCRGLALSCTLAWK